MYLLFRGAFLFYGMFKPNFNHHGCILNFRHQLLCEFEMSLTTQIASKIKFSSGYFFVVILMFIYFSFYAVKGERGLIRYFALINEVAQARQVLAKYDAEKQQWEDKVKLLSSDSLDLDMLDERAHIVLNMVHPNEFVVLDESLVTQ